MARDDEVIDTSRRDHVCDRDGLFGLYWIVGDHATANANRRPQIGYIRFEDGPYGSLNDAKLVRPTIGACSEDGRRAG